MAAAAAIFFCPARLDGAEAGAKIGVVDTEKVLEKLLSWQDARARLRAEEQKGEKALVDLRKEIDRIRAEMAYFRPGSRDHEKRKAAVAARERKLAKLSEDLRRTLAGRSAAALAAAEKQIREVVRAYAIANQFDVVVDARAVFYVAGGADISFEVAREINKRYKDGADKDKPEPREGK